MNADIEQQIGWLMERYIARGEIGGAGLVAMHGGSIVFERYAGHAAPGLAGGPEVLWPLASISKVYSAAAIMRLVERGELTLNTLACLVIAEFTGGGREEVRLRHLLTHTAGMIYESPLMEERLRAHTSLAGMTDEAIETELLFPPGTAISYADYHYLLAGRMAEIAAGRPFHELVRMLVLDAAGLAQTFFPPAPADYGRIARVRGVLAEGTDGAMYNSRYALGLAHPAFGVVATTRDLAMFARHFMPGGPRIHSEATVRAMIRDQTGGVRGLHPAMRGYSPEMPVPWGLGWYLQTAQVPAVLSDLLSQRAFGHGGASGCLVVADPEQDLVVAVTSNTHVRIDAEGWRRRLQALVNCAVAGMTGQA